ncbi:hypothetical protein CJP74_00910 [Psittacicella melopsittaci]|uniref:Conjugal transfer pilus assembly protein TraB n=1 Tax=Psittacicella melopsittaci TaxID=2028576 RepID=A0A3A1Y9E0_9GAMM|nr:TrbI/VirB10 family protein [Psittacicella melopsittaci]RIY33830.1 hypothetical protein CJP74_00910 [Psittacicella melopsittaci]
MALKNIWHKFNAKQKRLLVLTLAIFTLLLSLFLFVYKSSPEDLNSPVVETPQIKVLNTQRLDDFTIASLSNTLERQQAQIEAQQKQIQELRQLLAQAPPSSPPQPEQEDESSQALVLWQELWQQMAGLTPNEQCALYYDFIQQYPHLRNANFERIIQFNLQEWESGVKTFDPLAEFSTPEVTPFAPEDELENWDPPTIDYIPPEPVPVAPPKLEIRSLTREEPAQASINVPSGAVFTGTIVTGVDAPTTDGAKADPYPVLVRLDNLDFLPNSYRSNLDACFVLLSAYGDISSHRALMRLQTLSCVNSQGYIVEGEVKGYVVGDDGKIGVPGRLVSKQGSVIAKSLAVGFLQGVSDAFASPNVIIPGYGNAPPSVGQMGLGGSLQGTSRALDRIANFYLTLANKMFPLIEVQAGVGVDLVVTSPIALNVSERKVQAQPLGQASQTKAQLNTQLWQTLEE